MADRPSSVLFNIFNRQPILVKDVTTEADSITVELPKELDEEEYKRLKQLEAIKAVHNFIFSRITLVKTLSILSFICSALLYYAEPSAKGPLANHKMLLLPILDLNSVLACFFVYKLTICQIVKERYTMVIIMETTFTLVTLMMILVSTIIVMTDAIEHRNTMRFSSGCMALVGIAFQLCSDVMTILKYRPVPFSKQQRRSPVLRTSPRPSTRPPSRAASLRNSQPEKESIFKVTKL